MEFSQLLDQLIIALPEVLLALFISTFLVVDSLTKSKYLPVLHKATVLFCLGLGAYCLGLVPTTIREFIFSGGYVSDGMGLALKGFAAFSVALILIVGANYARNRGMFKGELHALALFCLLGQFVLISANHLLLVYLGVELLSLSLYAAVAMRRDDAKATEAAMKYFVLGALASGFLLYGMSMIYGASGSLHHADIAFAAAGSGSSLVFVFGLVFVVAGLAFKLGVVPFHMWVPDVYQGAPSIATLLISSAPKLAAFAMMMRLLVEGLYPKVADWQQMLMVLAMASLAVGNLSAIAQTNLKRMLAYSTIAQMGFMLLGMLAGTAAGDNAVQGYSASMFYVITYVMTTVGTFGVIMAMSSKGLEVEHIADLKGLNQRSPWLAFVMLLLMFSLAGIPPMVGFSAKLAVLKSLIDTDQVFLAVYAVLFSLLAAFYYIRIVKTMYFEDSVIQGAVVVSTDEKTVIGLNGFSVLVFGLLPAPLLAMCFGLVQQAMVR